ncbi:MAG: DUF983 domain-containing protein [Planctomycetaceae bacterium]|nr:DUF983 domain-containing protein [Planctomycetaceae bacterium]
MKPENLSAEQVEIQRSGLTALTLSAAFSRGIRLVCPACANSRLFRGWFGMHENCEHCGFHFERAPGYFLGSTYINYGLTTLTSTISYVVLQFGLGVPKTPVVIGIATFCVIFPLVFFRFARSLWLSIDCFIDRTGALETIENVTSSLEKNSLSEIES